MKAIKQTDTNKKTQAEEVEQGFDIQSHHILIPSEMSGLCQKKYKTCKK